MWYCAKKGHTLITHQEGQTTSRELTPAEQEKLNFLNLCIPIKDKKGDLTTFQAEIETYFTKQQEKAKKRNNRRNKLNKRVNNTHLAYLNQTIKTYPQLFIDTISPFKARYPNQLVDKIIQRAFPHLFHEKEQADFW
ncbi:MAG: hypothetical protein LBG52_03605 [Candidatus Peribacteria bacterium]|jgi:predicted metal-dependent hydrolase|nr:hypothetical protein [Candidatus Peribacteria bacterium]